MDVPVPRTFSHAEIKRVVTGIMLCILLAALDQTVVIPAVPAIAGELQAFGHLSWIVTAYLLTSTAATPPSAGAKPRGAGPAIARGAAAASRNGMPAATSSSMTIEKNTQP